MISSRQTLLTSILFVRYNELWHPQVINNRNRIVFVQRRQTTNDNKLSVLRSMFASIYLRRCVSVMIGASFGLFGHCAAHQGVGSARYIAWHQHDVDSEHTEGMVCVPPCPVFFFFCRIVNCCLSSFVACDIGRCAGVARSRRAVGLERVKKLN
jgi:hypothetical protein